MLDTLASLVITCADLIAPQPKPLPMVHFAKWIMACPALPAPCRLAEARQLALPGGPAQVKIYVSKTPVGFVVDVETPPLVMPSAVLVIGETEDVTLETDDCTGERCRFHSVLEDKAAKAARHAESLTLVMTPEIGDTLKVPFEMDGYERGIAALPDEF